MDKQHGFQILLAIICLCICVGSLAILPITNVEGVSVLEVPKIDFEQAEFEEDLLIVAITAITIAGLVFTKVRSTNLNFPSACLSPVSPPPKHS